MSFSVEGPHPAQWMEINSHQDSQSVRCGIFRTWDKQQTQKVSKEKENKGSAIRKALDFSAAKTGS